jgi:hypothetical protein
MQGKLGLEISNQKQKYVTQWGKKGAEKCQKVSRII